MAALVPSAGTITLKIELRSDADAVSTLAIRCVSALRSVRPTHQKGDTGYGADDARPAPVLMSMKALIGGVRGSVPCAA